MPGDSDTQTELQRLKKTASLLDSWVRVPGTRFSFGIDSLLGLIPVVGDTAMLACGLWFVYRAGRIGISKPVLLRMLANVGIDYAIGSVPVIGDLFDFFWKANLRNLALLEKEIERRKL